MPPMPPEIWHHIARHLDVADLQTFRLVCKAFAEIGLQHVDTVVVVMIPESFDAVRRFLRRPRARHHIQNLICFYDPIDINEIQYDQNNMKILPHRGHYLFQFRCLIEDFPSLKSISFQSLKVRLSGVTPEGVSRKISRLTGNFQCSYSFATNPGYKLLQNEVLNAADSIPYQYDLQLLHVDPNMLNYRPNAYFLALRKLHIMLTSATRINKTTQLFGQMPMLEELHYGWHEDEHGELGFMQPPRLKVLRLCGAYIHTQDKYTKLEKLDLRKAALWRGRLHHWADKFMDWPENRELGVVGTLQGDQVWSSSEGVYRSGHQTIWGVKLEDILHEICNKPNSLDESIRKDLLEAIFPDLPLYAPESGLPLDTAATIATVPRELATRYADLSKHHKVLRNNLATVWLQDKMPLNTL